MSRTVLLGPLTATTELLSVVKQLDGDAPIAVVTAGWEEGERNDADLDRRLGGGTRNLGLYGRLLDVLETDGDYAQARHELRMTLAEMQAVYEIRITHLLAAIAALRRRYQAARRAAGTELDAAIRELRDVDEAHAADVMARRAGFEHEFPAEERDVIVAHREAVRALLDDCAIIAIAGGHVGVLTDCMRLFHAPGGVSRSIIAWSSAALAISERVVVVDDQDIAARPGALFDVGLGLVAGIVPLPEASRRLQLDDADQLATLARRLAPRACVLLDAEDRVDCIDATPDLGSARLLTPEGDIRTNAAA